VAHALADFHFGAGDETVGRSPSSTVPFVRWRLAHARSLVRTRVASIERSCDFGSFTAGSSHCHGVPFDPTFPSTLNRFARVRAFLRVC